MRTASLSAAATLLLAATPAFATSSIHCRTSPGGPDIWLSVSDEPGGGIFQARIIDGREEILANARPRTRPWIAYSRVNPRRLSISIVFGRGSRATVESLIADRRGVPYVGGFSWRGRSLRARCFWDEDDEG
jgi:hypothetical protein